MTKNLAWAVVVITAALLQSNWLGRLSVLGAVPDFSVLLVVYFALTEGEERAMWTGVLGGLFQDVAGSSILGHHILCLVTIGYVIGRLSSRLLTFHPAVKAGLVFGAALVNGALYVIIDYVQKPDPNAVNLLLTRVVPVAFYTAIVTPLAFWLLDRIAERFLGTQGGAA